MHETQARQGLACFGHYVRSLVNDPDGSFARPSVTFHLPSIALTNEKLECLRDLKSCLDAYVLFHLFATDAVLGV